MGTRGIFYLYVTIKGKRILIYAFYTQYDGYDVISDLVEYFMALTFPATIRQVLEYLDIKYPNATGYFPGDAEAVYHYTLSPVSDVSEINNLKYVEPFHSSYGSRITGNAGDCYIYETHEDRDEDLAPAVDRVDPQLHDVQIQREMTL
jgi:hypothetical protein